MYVGVSVMAAIHVRFHNSRGQLACPLVCFSLVNVSNILCSRHKFCRLD